MFAKLTDQQSIKIESQIKERSIPYDYDTKEYPIEVIALKYQPKEGEPSMFIPQYQRALVWTKARQVKFIESLFLGVPIPPIFVAIMDETGNLEIIDGSQRIRTIAMYLSDELVLKDMDEIESLNNTRFSQLSISRQRKFQNISLRFHVVTEKADLAIRADIFDRLNSNVKALIPSEIRKGAYANNQFYQFVLQQSQIKEFNDLLPVNFKNEEKEELTLRFFAYSERYLNFKHDVAVFLNRYIDDKTKEGFDAEIMSNNFKSTLSFVSKYFPDGFKKGKGSKQVPRVRFEAIAVGSYLALLKNAKPKPDDMIWINSTEFKKYTTTDASNNRSKLLRRIEFVRDCLLGNILPQTLNY